MSLIDKRKWKVVSKERRTVDGIVFDSGAEARRYSALKLAEKAGKIFALKRGQRTDIFLNGIKVAHYTPDFEYLDKTGMLIIEEVKSSGTSKSPYYKLRRRLYEAYTGLQVTENIVK